MIEYASNVEPLEEREHEDVKAYHVERNRLDEECGAAIVARRLGHYLKAIDLSDEAEFCKRQAQRYRERNAHASATAYQIASAALLEASEQMKAEAA